MDWCRLHHGVSSDPKWRLVAKKAGVRVGDVLSVWTYMMDHASQAQPRGTLGGWDDELCAIALDYEPEAIAAIRAAMQGRTLDGLTLTGWDRRQPKREDDGATERKRAQRERDKAKTDDVTQCHAASRNVTTEQNRAEQIPSGITGSNEPSIPDADCAASDNEDEPDLFHGASGDDRETAEVIHIDPVKALFDHGVEILTRAGSSEKGARKIVGQLRSAKGDREAMAIITAAARSTDPVSYIQAARTRGHQDRYPQRYGRDQSGILTTGAAI